MFKLVDKIRKSESFSSICIDNNYYAYSEENKMKVFPKNNISSEPILEITSKDTIIQSKLKDNSNKNHNRRTSI